MKLTESDIRPYITQEQINERIRELGQKITKEYQGKDLVLIGVLKGSFLFLADLCRHIHVPLEVDFLGLSSYGNRTESSGIVRLTSDLSGSIKDRDVLIVEDIIDTGLTMRYLFDNLQTRHPKSLKACACLHKPARSVQPTSIDYLGFTIEDHFVVGYGLDYQGKYRNLPFIGIVEKSN